MSGIFAGIPPIETEPTNANGINAVPRPAALADPGIVDHLLSLPESLTVASQGVVPLPPILPSARDSKRITETSEKLAEADYTPSFNPLKKA